MRDVSFQEALDDPDMPFRKFVAECVELRNLAVKAYEAQGSPFGPAEDGTNVTRWVEGRMDEWDAVVEAESILLDERCEE